MQQPEDRPGEQADPMAAEVDVRLFAGKQQEMLVRQTLAFGVQGPQQ